MAIRRKYQNENLVRTVDKIHEELCSSGHKPEMRSNFFPNLINKMGLKIGAEIGVDKGIFSNVLMQKSKLEKLYCIDIWQNEDKFELTKSTLKPWMDIERVEIIRKLSIDASKDIPDDSLDFCYIDGDHSLEGIYVDLRAWIHKVKVGGILAGHDYKDGRASGTKDHFGYHLRNKVKLVVDDFCPRYGYKLKTIRSRVLNWYLVKNTPCEAKLVLAY